VLYALFCQYREPICRYLTRLTGDADRAEELAQETFIRAYRALERGERWENPRAWLYRVASRLAINDYWRHRLLQWLPLRSTDAEVASTVEASTAERLAVQRALAQLAPQQRMVLLLCLDEGYPAAEVAEMMDLSVDAVRMRLCRARQAFQRVYQGQERDLEERLRRVPAREKR
jgi:RNA polymerase sigma-70 factor (ECF subfamily)